MILVIGLAYKYGVYKMLEDKDIKVYKEKIDGFVDYIYDRDLDRFFEINNEDIKEVLEKKIKDTLTKTSIVSYKRGYVDCFNNYEKNITGRNIFLEIMGFLFCSVIVTVIIIIVLKWLSI